MILDLFIPYWGDPSYLRRAVRSVLDQDDPLWRLTVIDDAYPDPAAGEWLRSLQDPRITYVRKERNEGITANYRSCIEHARGSLMVMIGSDDELLPGYVAALRRAHDAYPEAAIIQPGVEVIDDEGCVIRPLADRVKQGLVRPRATGYRLLSGESLAANLLLGDWLYWPSLAFRTERIRAVSLRDEFPIIQDLALVIDMVRSGDQLLIAPEVTFRYRRHPASASSVKLLDGSRFAGERDYFELAAAQMRELGWRRAELAARARLTSRAHAVTLTPTAAIRRDGTGLRTLVRHALGR